MKNEQQKNSFGFGAALVVGKPGSRGYQSTRNSYIHRTKYIKYEEET